MDDRLVLAIKRLERVVGRTMGTPGGPPKEFCEDVIIVIRAARATEETRSDSLHLPASASTPLQTEEELDDACPNG